MVKRQKKRGDALGWVLAQDSHFLENQVLIHHAELRLMTAE